MSKSIKLSNNMFIDSKSVDYKRVNLETTIDGIKEKLNNVGVYSSNEIEKYEVVEGLKSYTNSLIEAMIDYCIKHKGKNLIRCI